MMHILHWRVAERGETVCLSHTAHLSVLLLTNRSSKGKKGCETRWHRDVGWYCHAFGDLRRWRLKDGDRD